MNRKDFGELVRTLREEQGWSQEEFGEITLLEKTIIGKIERGKQVNLTESIVVSLADSLELTPVERKEFLIAAAGIDQKKMFKDEPIVFLDALLGILSNVRLPAFILDQFGDVVAVNPLCLAFYGVTKEELDNSTDLSKYNLMRILFSSDITMKSNLLEQERNTFSHNTILIYRGLTLRSRAHPYFRALFNELCKKHKEFKHYWIAAPQLQKTYKPLMNNASVELRLGETHLKTTSSTITSVTPAGDLNFYSFLPLSLDTANLFSVLSEQIGTSAIRLATWPEKPI